MVMEEFFDCTTRQGVLRDFEGELPQVPADPQETRRQEALGRLRALAPGSEIVHDFLIVLGLE